MSTLDQIRVFNIRYTNITPTATKYAESQRQIALGATAPNRRKYKSVNQLLKESPLVGTTKFGFNFIA